jgi:hypothetical protein
MVFYSVGTAGGSVASTATYAAAGWMAVCALGAAISLAALAVWVASRTSQPARLVELRGRSRILPETSCVSDAIGGCSES